MLIKIFYNRTFTNEDIVNVIVTEASNDDTKDTSKYIVNDDEEGVKDVNTFSMKKEPCQTSSTEKNRKRRGKKILSMIIYSKAVI